RACETTCPSGVEYAKLLDIGRTMVDDAVPRPVGNRMTRRLLRLMVPYSRRFGTLLAIGQPLRPLLRGPLHSLADKMPKRQKPLSWPDASQATRRMLVLEGCVQPSAAPRTNACAARLFARLGIELVAAPQAGCCGALSRHLSAGNEADAF